MYFKHKINEKCISEKEYSFLKISEQQNFEKMFEETEVYNVDEMNSLNDFIKKGMISLNQDVRAGYKLPDNISEEEKCKITNPNSILSSYFIFH